MDKQSDQDLAGASPQALEILALSRSVEALLKGYGAMEGTLKSPPTLKTIDMLLARIQKLLETPQQ